MMKQNRCPWCEKDDLYRKYHDEEWGKPNFSDVVFFELLLLESFQAGLSWYTILAKREAFRLAFDAFDVQKIANYNQEKIDELLANAAIVRNKLKIQAAINNAQLFMEIQKEYLSFSNYIWSFVGNKPLINLPEKLEEIQATTPLSDIVAKELKKRGFKFMGSTVVYSFLQATGLVNDHLQSCWKSK
jgi:DNA-3-methyladenine glycosylase I